MFKWGIKSLSETGLLLLRETLISQQIRVHKTIRNFYKSGTVNMLAKVICWWTERAWFCLPAQFFSQEHFWEDGCPSYKKITEFLRSICHIPGPIVWCEVPRDIRDLGTPRPCQRGTWLACDLLQCCCQRLTGVRSLDWRAAGLSMSLSLTCQELQGSIHWQESFYFKKKDF